MKVLYSKGTRQSSSFWDEDETCCATPQVLVRWACDKVSAAAGSTSDEQLMEELQVG